MANKKGVELGINFIVLLILSVVVFIFGVAFIFKALTSVGAILDKAKPEIYQELDKKLADGEIVATYPSTLTINRGKSGIFGVAVYNELSDAKNFKIEPESSEGILTIKWAEMSEGKADLGTIQPGSSEKKLFLVGVNTNTPSTIYPIHIKVYADEKPYEDIVKIVYVTVP